MADIFSKYTLEQINNIKTKKLNIGKNPVKIGFTCSSFDVLHAGHMIMLADAKKQCDYLVVGLQTDPTIDRPNEKNKPVQEYSERKIMISGVKYVDEIIEYATENDLYQILTELNPDIRILGSDWKGKKYTGCELPIPIYWHERDHEYSTTSLRERIYEAEKKKKENLSIQKTYTCRTNIDDIEFLSEDDE